MRRVMFAVLLSTTAYAGPITIDVGGRLTPEFIGIHEKGRAIWLQAFRRAEALLKKLEQAVGGELEEHERQCFLQEAVKHFAPEAKDGTKMTGSPQGDVTPDFLRHVLEKLDQVNRCSPTNRGYLAFHSWRATGFQEPRQLPSGEKRTLLEFLRAAAAAGAGASQGAPVPSPAALVPLLNPELFMPRKPKPGEGT